MGRGVPMLSSSFNTFHYNQKEYNSYHVINEQKTINIKLNETTP